MLLKSAQIPVVVDPVFSPTHGKNFLDQKAIPRFRKLLSQIDLLTPNVQETSSLSEIGISNLRDLETAGHHLLKCGAKALLLKGGHLENLEATDILLDKGNTHFFKKSRIEKTNCHGTGCAYSAAITALLARNYSLKESIRLAKTWLHQAIQNASSFGKGNPPIDFFTSFPSTK
jgi:hydroxymethylpyrimidine/phosphomethylpyrimidine kinase